VKKVKKIARVLTSMDATTVLAGETNVPTGCGFILTAGPPATIVSTGSKVGPTASPIVRRRKGKEVMVESDTPKKKKLQEQIDAQMARELEEQQEKEDLRMNKQIDRDVEVTRIHAEEEIQGQEQIDAQVARELEEQQEREDKRMTEQIARDVEVLVEDFIPMGSKEEVKRLKRKGFNLKQEKAKKQKTLEEVPDKEKSLEEIPEEKGEGSGTPTEPHHTPSQEAQPSPPTDISSSSIPTVIPIPTVTHSEPLPLRKYTRRARIAQSSALPPVADEPASPVRDVSKGEACPTDSGFMTDQDKATIDKSSTLPYDTAPRVTSPAAVEGTREVEINKLEERVKILEDNQGVIGARSADDAPIKGRRIDEVAVERTSEYTEEMATVLTSMDAATVFAGGIDVPTGSVTIPTTGPPVVDIHTSSDAVPTAKHPSDTKVLTMKMEILLEPTSNKILVGDISVCYQFFMDLLKNLDREDLNQLWVLVKEYLSIRLASSDKEMELWVELQRLYEPDPKDQLWAQTQNYMHAPIEWKLYDLSGVHHVTAKDKEICMLVEKDYPLRKGLALVMICYKLQVENYLQIAEDLIQKIYNIANSPRQQEGTSHCLKKNATARGKVLPLPEHYDICLTNNKKFNFSKYILDNLKKNLEGGVPFYMFPRAVTPLFDTMMVQAIEEVGGRKKERKESKETKVSPTEDLVPTTSNDPLLSGEDSMQLKELMILCTNLSNKVLDLENEVIEIKSSHQAKIAVLKSRVEKLNEENMSLTKELKSFTSKVESPAVKETVM
nr:hypothetical protein [Tanacetum cinerariifolium]